MYRVIDIRHMPERPNPHHDDVIPAHWRVTVQMGTQSIHVIDETRLEAVKAAIQEFGAMEWPDEAIKETVERIARGTKEGDK